MVVLVDTNVILDLLMKREPFAYDAREILVKCAEGEISGYLAAHSIPNLFYILRKEFTEKERRSFIISLCDIFRISQLDSAKILSAAKNEDFSDYEDCLQEECAVDVMADYIVTRNPADYKKSRVSTIQPAELLALLSGKGRL